MSGYLLYCYDGFSESGEPLTTRQSFYRYINFVSVGNDVHAVCIDTNSALIHKSIKKCKVITEDEYNKNKK